MTTPPDDAPESKHVEPRRDESRVVESLLDARDQLIGIQAQLDELHERLEAMERRAARGAGRWRRMAARARPRRGSKR